MQRISLQESRQITLITLLINRIIFLAFGFTGSQPQSLGHDNLVTCFRFQIQTQSFTFTVHQVSHFNGYRIEIGIQDFIPTAKTIAIRFNCIIHSQIFKIRHVKLLLLRLNNYWFTNPQHPIK